jgi:hypothetical protein
MKFIPIHKFSVCIDKKEIMAEWYPAYICQDTFCLLIKIEKALEDIWLWNFPSSCFISV